MKAKLIRCSICKDWFSPFRSHCPNCGAAEIAKGVFVSVVSGKLLPIASGILDYQIARYLMSIAK